MDSYLEAANTTALGIATAPAFDPIGLALGVVSLIQSALFIYAAVIGIGNQPGLPPVNRGVPWIFGIQTALERSHNETDPDSRPLVGAAGPFPDVYVFNDNGDMMGTQINQNKYAKQNTFTSLELYPINRRKYEGQDATFVMLAAKRGRFDPLCVVDMSLTQPKEPMDDGSGNGPSMADNRNRAYAFNGYTARACGAPWYHSGVYRRNNLGVAETVPCVWIGSADVGAMQIHMPSHTADATSIDKHKANSSSEALHDAFCNTPAVMHWWPSPPPHRNEVVRLLETDRQRRGDRTLESTLRDTLGTELPGSSSSHDDDDDDDDDSVPVRLRPRWLSSPDAHADTITVARVHDRGQLSAKALCTSPSSVGPDFVNVVEKKFCRMADKTLWPTCDFEAADGPLDDCFDVELHQLVLSGKAVRDVPYSRVISLPVDE